MRLVIGAALVVAFAGTASAATVRRVPADYANIQAAEDACADGDTILVARGRYILASQVDIDVPNVIVVGKGAIVDCTTTGGTNIDGFNVTASGVTITGFKFVNGDNAIYCAGANLKVARCTFIDQANDSIYFSSGNGPIVESNRFIGTEGTGVEAYVDNARFTKNTLRGADDYGFYVSGAGPRFESNSVQGTGYQGIYITNGANAVVLKNKVFNTSDQGIEFNGADVRVEGNTVRMCDNDPGILGDGSSPFVSKNKISYAGGGIAIYNANGAEILSNKVVDIHENRAGFDIEADSMTVVGNTVAVGSYYSWGFELYGNSVTGTGLVENNTAAEMTDAGFYLGSSFNGMEVRNCTAKNCGIYDAAGFYIRGSLNSTFEGLKVMNQDNTGFYIYDTSNGNTFTKCSVNGAFGDGFRMQDGDDNEFIDCTAANCGGEGFDNRGTNTTLTGGKYRGDRNDVADSAGGANITLNDVDKSTPGTPVSQVD